MKKVIGGFALGAFLCIGAPASAAQLMFSLTGNSAGDGANGNGRTYSATSGATTVNLRASGWSIDGLTIRDSFLGAFAEGLGVTSGDDSGGGSHQHTVDNHGRTDFILLQFDQSVSLVSAKFSTFNVLGLGRDSDATIAHGMTSLDWRTQAPLDGLLAPLLTTAFDGGVTSLGTAAGGTRNLGTGDARGNLWLVAADVLNEDGKIDGFKFSNLTVNVPTVAVVPEPASWAMMIAGFGLVGGAMRRQASARPALA